MLFKRTPKSEIQAICRHCDALAQLLRDAPEADRREALQHVRGTLSGLALRLRLERPAPPTIPPRKATGGSTFEHEIRWALDAVRRGDTDLAEGRLKRLLTGRA
jgi:hypothetical protein